MPTKTDAFSSSAFSSSAFSGHPLYKDSQIKVTPLKPTPNQEKQIGKLNITQVRIIEMLKGTNNMLGRQDDSLWPTYHARIYAVIRAKMSISKTDDEGRAKSMSF